MALYATALSLRARTQFQKYQKYRKRCFLFLFSFNSDQFCMSNHWIVSFNWTDSCCIACHLQSDELQLQEMCYPVQNIRYIAILYVTTVQVYNIQYTMLKQKNQSIYNINHEMDCYLFRVCICLTLHKTYTQYSISK